MDELQARMFEDFSGSRCIALASHFTRILYGRPADEDMYILGMREKNMSRTPNSTRHSAPFSGINSELYSMHCVYLLISI